jgi:hypothetical protein
MDINDIKLMESQRLTDDHDGGGRMTGRVIVDGDVNKVFKGISRLTRTYGEVSTRKMFAVAMTQDNNILSGAHCILTQSPNDPNISVTLFSTGSHTDTRVEVQDKIESYVVRGPKTNMELLGTQLQGQRVITVYQRENVALPEVGEVFVLTEHENQSDEKEQYVRITEISHKIQTFFVAGNCGEFKRRVITLGIGEPLRNTFQGNEATCHTISHDANIRTTQIANAAMYYGTVPLIKNITAGHNKIQVQTIYNQLVPTTRIETPLIDLQAGGEKVTLIKSGSLEVEVTNVSNTYQIEITQQNRSYNYVANLQPIPAPGTISVDYCALRKWYTLTDDGTGTLVGEGSATFNSETGSILISPRALPDVGSSIIIYWGTTIHYEDQAGNTDYPNMRIEGTLGTGGIIPSTVMVTWEGGEKTYSISDDGKGHLIGNGTGKIIYASGKYVLETLKLPDSEHLMTLNYSYSTVTTISFTPTQSENGYIEIFVPTPIKPGSVQLEWTVGHHYLTTAFHSWANDNIDYDLGLRSAIIRLSDDASGKLLGIVDSIVDYSLGRIQFKPQQFFIYRFFNGLKWFEFVGSATFTDGDNLYAHYQLNTVSSNNGVEQLNAPPIVVDLTPDVTSAVVPGSVRFRIGNTSYSDRSGQGVLYNHENTVVGRVKYDIGIATIDIYKGGENNDVIINSLITAKGRWFLTKIFFRTAGAPIQPGGFHIQATALDGTLIHASTNFSGIITDKLIAGVVNQENGVTRIEFGQLVLNSDLTAQEKQEWWYDPAEIDKNGYIWKPTPVYPNTVRYNIVVFSNLPLDASILGMDPVRLPTDGRVPIFKKANVIIIREPKKFVIPAFKVETLPNSLTSTQVINLLDSNLSICTLKDQNGTKIDNTDNAFYSVDLVNGQITMSDPLDLSTYTEPLLAEYRNLLSAGQTINLDNESIASISLIDQNEKTVSDAFYIADLATGQITLADPLDLSSLKEPLIVKYVIEDMTVVGDVQIDGTLTCINQITHNYNKASTLVSSAIIFGNLFSKVEYFFSQKTWTGQWSDSRIGSDTTAKFNIIQYPILVQNDGAIKERWVLIFTNSSGTFNIVGETVGIIGTGNTSTIVNPLNPETQIPYFIINPAGFGGGWPVGSVIRFNTQAAAAPFWVIRTVVNGLPTHKGDQLKIQIRGDVN